VPRRIAGISPVSFRVEDEIHLNTPTIACSMGRAFHEPQLAGWRF
jgi:hypothetical protein